MFETITDYLNQSDHYDKLIWAIIAGFIGAVIKDILFKYLGKIIRWFFFVIIGLFKRVISKMRAINISFKEKGQYKKKIKQIEKLEITIPDYFLFSKSREKNPELRRIFTMIEEGIISEPPSMKINKYIKDNPDILDKIINQRSVPYLPEIKPFKPDIDK
jgi:hypothetical protein